MPGCSERVVDAFKGMAALASSGKAGTLLSCLAITADNFFWLIIFAIG